MSAAFPEAFAAVLMPNHLHLLLPTAAPRATARLVRLLAFATKRSAHQSLWEPSPSARPIPNAQQVLGNIRYIHLNPCRARLVADPLSWPWSTHRDVVGARYEPWTKAHVMAAAVHRPRNGFACWFHAHVSNDSTVRIGGTPSPLAAPVRQIATTPLAHIVAAGRSATMYQDAQQARRAIVRLAKSERWPLSSLVGTTGVSLRTLQRVAANESVADSNVNPNDPALLCLGDARLRHLTSE